MDCKTCKEGRPADVPFIVHEADMARMERTNKRNTIIIVLLIIALLASWIGFMAYESKFETVTESETINDVDSRVRQGQA